MIEAKGVTPMPAPTSTMVLNPNVSSEELPKGPSTRMTGAMAGCCAMSDPISD